MIEIEITKVRESGDFSFEDQAARYELLGQYRYSVPVEASHKEIDMVEKWLANNVGKESESWCYIYFFKISYDYGYAEFFFSDKSGFDKFRANIESFYGEYDNGKKISTNGLDNFIEIA